MKESKVSTVRRRYARLPLALALGAMVLTPAVASALHVPTEEQLGRVVTPGQSSILLSGDARLRGFWREDAQFGNRTTNIMDGETLVGTTNDDTNRQLQHRMRVGLDVAAPGGTSLHTRFHMAGNFASGADGEPGGATSIDVWGAGPNDQKLNVVTDYFYVRVPVGPGTVIAGRQLITYGHQLSFWDLRGDRLTYTQKLNDEISLFGYYQKIQESQTGAGDGLAAEDEDRNLYAGGIAYKAGDLTANFQLRYQDEEWTTGRDGLEYIGFATYKMAALTLEFEGYFTSGDIFENTQGDNQQRAYLGAKYDMGDTTLTGGLAYSAAGSIASSHFGKISLFHNTGDGSGLGHSRFGVAPGGGAVDKGWAAGVGASHKLSPALTLRGRLAYTDYDLYANNATGNDDPSVIAFDASLAYKINASTTYHIDAIYASPDNVTAEDDAYWGLGHRFEIRF